MRTPPSSNRPNIGRITRSLLVTTFQLWYTAFTGYLHPGEVSLYGRIRETRILV